MIIYLVLCLPASFIIDTYGVKFGLNIGAVLTIIGAIIKGFGAHSLLLVFIGQVFLAIAQPFILDAVTAFSVRWFRLDERAIVAGLLALAQFTRILFAMLLTPMLVESSSNNLHYGEGIDYMLFIYMIQSVAAAVLFLIFFKKKPNNLPFDIQNE